MREEIFIIGTKIIPAYVMFAQYESASRSCSNSEINSLKKTANRKWNLFKKLCKSVDVDHNQMAAKIANSLLKFY